MSESFLDFYSFFISTARADISSTIDLALSLRGLSNG